MQSTIAMSRKICTGIVWAVFIFPFSAVGAERAAELNETIGLVPAEYRHELVQRLSMAEGKRDEWLAAIARAPAEQREAVAFLLVNMPERDLKSLTDEFVLRNVAAAFAARGANAWASGVPREIFLNDIVPYSNLNERRDDCRTDFAKRFGPLVKECKSAGEAAQVLNRAVFKAVNVAYHASKRPKPDQSPYESIEAGFASCSGLSILLVDACRAVGVPARVAGTPMWSDGKGNHTWVEIWDGQWRFIGAAEPGEFNQTWFAANAAKADGSKAENRIYAASFRRTKTPFVLVWDPASTEYSAVDVTAYYIGRRKLKVATLDEAGKPGNAFVEVRQGGFLLACAAPRTAEFELAAGSDYVVRALYRDGRTLERTVRLPAEADLVTELRETGSIAPASTPAPTSDLDGDWARMRSIVPRGYVCRRAKTPINIDGHADKSVWAEAVWTEDFVDIEGSRRPAPRFRTRAKMLWDDDNLYILAELEEPHVWGTITKKNEVMFQDNDFEVFLCPSGTHHSYYEFEMNALNSIWELTLVKPYRDGGPAINATNVEGLRSAVHVNGTLNDATDTDRSWCAEIAIPWKGLARYSDGQAVPPKDGDRWRANFSRVEWLVDILNGKYRKIPKEMRPEDNWVWSPTGVVDMHRPERWGYVQFSSSNATSEFQPDPTLPSRDALMAVYYRQRTYRERFGHYANSAEQLGITEPKLDIGLSGDGYIATISQVRNLGGETRTLRLRQDSKITDELAVAPKIRLSTKAGECVLPADPIGPLAAWLARPPSERTLLSKEVFAAQPLTRAQAAKAKDLLWEDQVAAIRSTRTDEWRKESLTLGDHTLKWKQRYIGQKPKDGWNLYISLHGGGNAPVQVNDQQWANQIKLYQPKDSLYLAPRAPTNTWNLWHEPHMDGLLDRLIEDAVVLGEVNPNRVYIMGYSAGGDGVYQLAPRMADRWAAASMMAGHPNDASPLGLRNIGFTAHVGALDGAYDRNKVAAKWGGLLDDLRKEDPNGYAHEVKIHDGRSHWMNLEDAVAVDWMAQFTRNPLPQKVVWKQSSVTHDRFYWLAVPTGEAKGGQLLIVKRIGQEVHIEKAEQISGVTVMLNDAMVDLDQPVRIVMGGKELSNSVPIRTVERLAASLRSRGDRDLMFPAEVTVSLR
jgi:transglutaminase-like putative cysteine protease